MPSHAAYNATKAGVANLTRLIACDMGRYGVRTHTVAPGLTVTGMVDETMKDEALLDKRRPRVGQVRASRGK